MVGGLRRVVLEGVRGANVKSGPLAAAAAADQSWQIGCCYLELFSYENRRRRKKQP